MFLPRVMAAASQHAIAEYPKECCGLVVDNHYVPLDNPGAISAKTGKREPTESIEIDPAVFPKYGDRLQAILHSHPDWYPVPSAEDMRGQMRTALPWGVFAVTKDQGGKLYTTPATWWGAGAPKQPLLGRGFIHGVQDCFEGLLDWHRAPPRNMEFPTFPRDWEWWLPGEDGAPAKDLYRDYFRDYGCEPIGEARPGAVGLVPIGKDREGRKVTRPNHAFIYLAGGLIYHHLSAGVPIDPARIAAREPWGRWMRHFNAPPIWIMHRDMTPARAEGGL